MTRLVASWLRVVTVATCVAAGVMVRAEDGPQTVLISTLDLSEMTCGWGEPRVDRGIVSDTIRIRGKTFAHGIGTHAPSKLRIGLRGGGDRFTCITGMDDSADGHGGIRFMVVADGVTVWDSGVVGGAHPAMPVDLDVRGVDVLELIVTDGGDGAGYDHADWADARITMMPNTEPPVSLPAYDQVRLNTQTLSLVFVVDNDGRLYQSPIGSSTDGMTFSPEDLAYPQGGYGYDFEPALLIVHADGNRSTSLKFQGVERQAQSEGVELVRIGLRDEAYALDVTLNFRLHHDRDVIEQWVEVANHEGGPIVLERMASSALSLGTDANLRLVHFYGNWYDEMNRFVEPVTPGTKVLDSKLLVRSHQFTLPSFVLSLDGEPSETSGRVLAGSLAWTGSFQAAIDDTGKRVRALVGVNPYESAYRVKPGEMFTTPVMIWTWSDAGLGDMSRKLHAWARDFGVRDGHTPRQVLLNNWEATGFDFDFDRIVSLYEPAKEIGVELFLLDDGWFGNKYPRINDKAGLGDWEPNRQRFSEGLAPLAKAAEDRGLRFGIWIEPEMVNPKSELFEQHPDWAIQQPNRAMELQRHQLALDNTLPEVREHEWQVIHSVLGVPGISYVKWDANRYTIQSGSPSGSAEDQTRLRIDYTRHLYDLMAKTAQAYPDIELMLCSGGGGRVDYGALKYFHEFWPSDNTDAVRRVTMQWNYSYFFPPIAMCSHVTHTGNRPMHFACAVAMSARFGLDIDVAALSADDRRIIAGAIAAYKQIRDVVHLGDLYRVEDPHNAARGVQNYVAADRSRAVVFVFQLESGPATPVKPQGLDPNRRYTITEVNPAPGRTSLPQEGRTFTGAEIMSVGIEPATSDALQATIIELKS